jgi:hypothetical protein
MEQTAPFTSIDQPANSIESVRKTPRPLPEKRMNTTWNRWIEKYRRLTLPRLAMTVAASLALAFSLSACENVASYTQSSLVRVIDASFIAPAVNIYVEGTMLAGNIGEGYISEYGTLSASGSAIIKVTAATGGKTLVSSTATLTAGAQHSVFLTDNGAAATSYTVTVLEDQQVAAASGHSAFRFINEAPATGGVDIYMVPSGSTLANTKILVSNLAVGATAGYTSFTSQTVTMVVVPTGTVTTGTKVSNEYTSTSLALTGGEVRTVMIIDSELTSNPPVSVVIAKDVN